MVLLYCTLSLAIMFAYWIVLAAIPFRLLSYRVRRRDSLPSSGSWNWKGMVNLQRVVKDVFQPDHHWEAIVEIIGSRCAGLKRPFALMFGGTWKKLERNKFFRGPISFMCFTAHLLIVSALVALALAALPFITPYCQIRYKVFPPNYEYVLWNGEYLGKPGKALVDLYGNHQYKTEQYARSFWNTSKKFLLKFGGIWKKTKELIRKPATTPVASTAAA